jgi:hypothetical protein
VDGTGTLSLDFSATPGRVVVSDGSYSTSVNLTNGTAAPSSGTSSNLGNPDGWCVALTDPAGSVRTFRYTAVEGLAHGTC